MYIFLSNPPLEKLSLQLFGPDPNQDVQLWPKLDRLTLTFCFYPLNPFFHGF